MCTPFLLVLRQAICVNMASDRAKWSNYVHSYISGTQGEHNTIFTGIRALVPGPQVRATAKIPLTV